MAKMKNYRPLVGQVWVDQDPRSVQFIAYSVKTHRRLLKVKEVVFDPVLGRHTVVCNSWYGTVDQRVCIRPRQTTISLHRFQNTNRGYALVKHANGRKTGLGSKIAHTIY